MREYVLSNLKNNKKYLAIGGASLIALIIILIFMFRPGKFQGVEIRLQRLVGTVKLYNEKGNNLNLIERMRLNSGNRVTTAEKSLVMMSIDETKLITMEAESSAKVTSAGKNLEFSLEEGTLFFNVTKKLEADATFDIRTSDMICSIRGTSGYSGKDNAGHNILMVTDGTVEVVATNPVTGETIKGTANQGEMLTVYLDDEAEGDATISFKTKTIRAEDIPPLALDAIRKDKELMARISKATGISEETIVALAEATSREGISMYGTAVEELKAAGIDDAVPLMGQEAWDMVDVAGRAADVAGTDFDVELAIIEGTRKVQDTGSETGCSEEETSKLVKKSSECIIGSVKLAKDEGLEAEELIKVSEAVSETLAVSVEKMELAELSSEEIEDVMNAIIEVYSGTIDVASKESDENGTDKAEAITLAVDNASVFVEDIVSVKMEMSASGSETVLALLGFTDNEEGDTQELTVAQQVLGKQRETLVVVADNTGRTPAPVVGNEPQAVVTPVAATGNDVTVGTVNNNTSVSTSNGNSDGSSVGGSDNSSGGNSDSSSNDGGTVSDNDGVSRSSGDSGNTGNVSAGNTGNATSGKNESTVNTGNTSTEKNESTENKGNSSTGSNESAENKGNTSTESGESTENKGNTSTGTGETTENKENTSTENTGSESTENTETTYDITVEQATGGTVTAYVGGSQSSKAASGQTVTLGFSIDTGYTITDIIVLSKSGNEEVVTVSGNSATFTMPAEAVTVKATYEAQTYTVTLNTNGGTITGDTVSSYKYGVGATLPAQVTKTQTAEKTYSFAGWYTGETDGNRVTSIGTSATGDKTYYAHWTEAARVYPVTLAATEDGTVEASVNGSVVTEAAVGDTVTLTATDGPTSTFVNWVDVNGNSGMTSSSSGRSVSFTMPAGEVSFKAVFEKKSYAINIEPAENGKVESGQGSGTAHEGDRVTLTIKPDEGYELDSISVKGDGGDVAISGSGDTRIFDMPASAVTVSAIFKPKKYTVSMRPENIGAHLSVTVKVGNDTKTTSYNGSEISLEADKNETVSVKVTSNDPGYKLETLIATEDVSFTKDDSQEGVYTFTMPAHDVSITALETIVTFDITVNCDDDLVGVSVGDSCPAGFTLTMDISKTQFENEIVEITEVYYRLESDSTDTKRTDWDNSNYFTYSLKMPAENIIIIVNSKKVNSGVTGSESEGPMSWNELVNFGVIAVENNTLKAVNETYRIAGKLIVDSSITEISVSAFEYCENLKEADISYVDRIGERSFAGCTSMTGIKLPDTLTTIPDGAFAGCRNLKDINISTAVEQIGMSAFSDCESLEDISWPTKLSSLGDNAFTGCTSLRHVEIYDNYTYLGRHAFEGCTSLSSVVLSGGYTTEIPEGLFYNCKNLRYINIDSEDRCDLTNFTAIGSYAFYNTAIIAVKLGTGIQEIGEKAFNFEAAEEPGHSVDVYYAGVEPEWDVTVGDGNDSIIMHYAAYKISVVNGGTGHGHVTLWNVDGEYLYNNESYYRVGSEIGISAPYSLGTGSQGLEETLRLLEYKVGEGDYIEIAIDENLDSYTFIMPDGQVEIVASYDY